MELIGWRGCWLDTPTLNGLRCRRMLTSPQAMSFEFLTTPILLTAAKAKDLYNAMYAHPATRVARDFIKRAKKLAAYTFAFREFDGATGNDKLYHHALPLVAPGDKMAACVCGNHCTIIAEQQLLLIGGRYQELLENRQPRCLVARPELLLAGLIMLLLAEHNIMQLCLRTHLGGGRLGARSGRGVLRGGLCL